MCQISQPPQSPSRELRTMVRAVAPLSRERRRGSCRRHKPGHQRRKPECPSSETPKANSAAPPYRNDAALKAWLAKRPPKRRWSRICRSSIRTTISGTRRIAATICCPNCWPISAAATTSSRPSSSNAARCTARSGPREMAALGEVEFVTGIAAMSASGGYGPCRVAEGIVGGGDLTRRRARARTAGSRDRRRRRAPARHAPRRGLGCPRGGRQIRLPRGPAAPGPGPEIPRRLRPACAARA